MYISTWTAHTGTMMYIGVDLARLVR